MSGAACTVVIPNYNGRRFLPALMASLAAQTRRDFEVVVVDDGSRDDGVDYLRREWPGVRVRVNGRNLGFAGTCNAGLREAGTPFVALLNNDTHVAPDWLAEALTPFDDSTVGSVASLVLLADPPHAIDTAGDLYSVVGGAMKRLHGAPREQAAGLRLDIFSACGASAFYRRVALDEVGLLDAALVSYYEDVELGFRLQLAGWRCVLAPRSICYHHLNSSYSPTGWTMHYHSSRNAEIVWWSRMPPLLRRRYLPARLIFLALQFGAELLRGRAASFLAGKRDAWRMRVAISQRRVAAARFTRVSHAAMDRRLTHNWWALQAQPRFRRLRQMLGWR
ncbi:MAG: glycosyltransferase family 2 protein [Phycisphaerae bacterium]